MAKKEKMELQSFKSSIVSIQQAGASESLVKYMADLKLKDMEIEKLRANLVLKDTHITSFKETNAQKKNDVKESQSSINQMKERIAKYNKKLVGKTPLIEAK